MKIYLETGRLLLRPFAESDVDNLFALDSNPDVMRFLNGGTPTPREAIEKRILPRILAFYVRYKEFGYWAAIEKASGEFIGWFALYPRRAVIRWTSRLATAFGRRPGGWATGPKVRKP